MCARKIKANELLVVHRHSVSVVAGLYKCTCYPHTRPPACRPFLYVRTYSQDVWPLIVLVGSVFRYHRLPPELLSTSLSLSRSCKTTISSSSFGSAEESIRFLLSFDFIALHYITFRRIYCHKVASHLCTFENAKYNNNEYNLFEELYDKLKTKKIKK